MKDEQVSNSQSLVHQVFYHATALTNQILRILR